MLMRDPEWAAVRHIGRIEGGWLRTVEVPAARAFTRGYDRGATEGLLDECADTIDELSDRLQFAHEEISELRRQARTRTARRSGTRVRRRGSGHARRRRVRVRRAVLG